MSSLLIPKSQLSWCKVEDDFFGSGQAPLSGNEIGVCIRLYYVTCAGETGNKSERLVSDFIK